MIAAPRTSFRAIGSPAYRPTRAPVYRGGGSGGAPAPVIPATGSYNANSGANYFSRTATLPNKAPVTFRIWALNVNITAFYAALMSLCYAGDDLFLVGTAVNGVNLVTYGGGSLSTDTGNQVLGQTVTWAHIVYTYDGTTCKVYVDGVLVSSAELDQAPNAATVLQILNNTSGAPFCGAVLAPAVWERVLSPAEVAADRAQLTPQAAGVWAWWLLEDGTDVADRSGNGRDLTLAGSGMTTVAGPGVPL